MAVANALTMGFSTQGYMPRIIKKENRYIYNVCTKYLARDVQDGRHNAGQYNDSDLRASICEPWRFPIIDSYYDAKNPEQSRLFNQVTFVYYQGTVTIPGDVAIVGTFANLYQPIPLEQVDDSPYFAVTLLIPKGEVHRYQYRVDGIWKTDPVNPQQVTLPNREVWSQCFTQSCSVPVTFEEWESVILCRLTSHILPFHTKAGQNFLDRYINTLDDNAKNNEYRTAYRLDESVGVVNYIDKLLAKEENHHLVDYRICLRLINRLLSQRIPGMDIASMPKSTFVQLYDEMANGNVIGWDYQQYNDPRFFLTLLRRHSFTGAFSHPKYHGNAGAAGWAYLNETFATPSTGETLFDWQLNCEAPYGKSEDYLG
jgi:hypothetical protein